MGRSWGRPLPTGHRPQGQDLQQGYQGEGQVTCGSRPLGLWEPAVLHKALCLESLTADGMEEGLWHSCRSVGGFYEVHISKGMDMSVWPTDWEEMGAWKEGSQKARPGHSSSAPRSTECHIKSFGWSYKLLKKLRSLSWWWGTFI